MLTSKLAPRRCRVAAGLLAVLLAVGCDDPVTNADQDAASAAPRVKERTVSIEFLHTGERTFEIDDTGVVTYGPMKPIGGVEICIVQRRKAFDSFKPFEALKQPICDTNDVDKLARLQGAPANSDLLITYEKAGYQPVLTTFRTDEYNVALQDWADQTDASTYYVPLLSADALRPDDSEVPAQDKDGSVAIWVYATGAYSVGPGQPVFNVDDDSGVGQAEGVNVKIENADGTSVTELKTRRDRPLFVSLPEASYRIEFTHPILELVPTGVQEQYMFGGLPTEMFNTIEVPVLRGYTTLSLVDGYCPLPASPAQTFTDLATCTLADAADASTQ